MFSISPIVKGGPRRSRGENHTPPKSPMIYHLFSHHHLIFSSMSDEEFFKHKSFMADLAHQNNNYLNQEHNLITKDRQVVPYFVKDNLQPKLVQPDWILKHEFKSITINKRPDWQTQEKMFRIFCSKGQILNHEVKGSANSRPNCVFLHHKDPYLKLGPFHVEIVNQKPYRSLLHNVSNRKKNLVPIKLSDRFRTVFESAVLCTLFPLLYRH